jgi:hypothetical protein
MKPWRRTEVNMRVGFFVQGMGEHWGIARHLIASAKRVMPDVEVWQLTDGDTPKVQGIDGCVRLGGKMPMALRRMKLHSMLHGEWLFLDTDVVVQQDVREMFLNPFLVAVTDRVGSLWEHSPDVEGMPYNMGVTFSRSPEFWAEVVERLKQQPAQLQEWCGDQLVVCALAQEKLQKVIPGRIYNFTPATRDEDCSHAAIVHYKGARKAWIPS